MSVVGAELAVRVSDLAPRAVRADIRVPGGHRPRAVRSLLHQAMTELGLELYRRPGARCAVVVLGGAPLPAPLTRVAVHLAEGLHARSEMLRGCPLALAVVFADETDDGDLAAQLRADAPGVPDGVCAMSAAEACAHGIRACAAASRI